MFIGTLWNFLPGLAWRSLLIDNSFDSNTGQAHKSQDDSTQHTAPSAHAVTGIGTKEETSPITTVFDYHRRFRTPNLSNSPFPPFSFSPSFDTLGPNDGLSGDAFRYPTPISIFQTSVASEAIASYITTPPISPSPMLRKSRPAPLSIIHPQSLSFSPPSPAEKITRYRRKQ